MCMSINKKDKAEIKKSELVADYRKGYKVIESDNTSPLHPYLYKVGENISNRKELKLEQLEESKGIVSKGFHIFLELKDALRY